MKSLRTLIFWLHLAAGLTAGLIIGIMSFTGVILAFEHQIVEWAERDARRIDSEPTGEPQSLESLITAAQEAATTDAEPSGLTLTNDPRAAIAISFGRETGTFYANPYSGEIRVPSTAMHDFMHLMIDWHRWLALSGEQRSLGRAITGASNLVFLFLAVSGLYLWWPRNWSRRVLKKSVWFTGAKGKARDWNWHNVYGFWSLPVLIVLIATGAVISYSWAGNLAYRAVGEAPPPPRGSAAAQSAAPEGPVYAKQADTDLMDYDAALTHVIAAFPEWNELTIRKGLPRRRGGPSPKVRADLPDPFSATVKTSSGPVFASSQLVLNPYTGAVLTQSGYDELTAGRKVRSWLRFLHTGEALGWPGQLLAGLASFGGVVLVYTGFALSWRRFFGKRSRT